MGPKTKTCVTLALKFEPHPFGFVQRLNYEGPTNWLPSVCLGVSKQANVAIGVVKTRLPMLKRETPDLGMCMPLARLCEDLMAVCTSA